MDEYSRGGRISSIVAREVWMSIAGREGWVDEYKNEEKFNVDKYTL